MLLFGLAQHHDLQQRADMQRIRRRVEADIGDKASLRRLAVELLDRGALVQEAAVDEPPQEIGLRLKRVGHGGLKPWGLDLNAGVV